MNKSSHRSIPALLLIGLVFLTSACKPAATSTPTFSLQGVTWQWTSVTNPSTNKTTKVPAPEKYTLIFNSDGSLAGEADCSSFDGTYSQEAGGITIKLGDTTKAFCGKDSLAFQYTVLLGNVAAGGPADGEGNLELEWAGGAQRMLFQNGGPATK